MGIRRSLKLINTLGSTAISVGAEKLQQRFNKDAAPKLPKSAIKLVEGLDSLKGAAMKLGQMLSLLDDNQLLPPEWAPILEKLQNEATPQPWQHIQPLVEGAQIDHSLFQSINPEAIHAASIGQVHRAELSDGRQIALKVRYPNLEESVKSDIRLMKMAFKLSNMFPSMEGMDDIAATVETMFLQELRFDLEKQFYDQYHQHFSKNDQIVIPETIDGLCSESTLATTWLEGVPIYRWIREQRESWDTPEIIRLRNHVSQILMEILLLEMFQLQSIQSDPNPGNFLITPDGKVGMIDFGATQTLPPHIVKAYYGLCHAFLSRDAAKILDIGLEAKMIFETDSEDIKNTFAQMMLSIAEPFQHETYDWNQCGLMQRINESALAFSIATRFRPPPPEIVFLNRRTSGNQLILEKLAGSFSARNILKNLISEITL